MGCGLQLLLYGVQSTGLGENVVALGALVGACESLPPWAWTAGDSLVVREPGTLGLGKLDMAPGIDVHTGLQALDPGALGALAGWGDSPPFPPLSSNCGVGRGRGRRGGGSSLPRDGWLPLTREAAGEAALRASCSGSLVCCPGVPAWHVGSAALPGQR